MLKIYTLKEIFITISNVDEDSDSDGVNDAIDLCPGTPSGESVDDHGCSNPNDSDSDGVTDAMDMCPDTPKGELVDAEGCSSTQKDTDYDGIADAIDIVRKVRKTNPWTHMVVPIVKNLRMRIQMKLPMTKRVVKTAIAKR